MGDGTSKGQVVPHNPNVTQLKGERYYRHGTMIEVYTGRGRVKIPTSLYGKLLNLGTSPGDTYFDAVVQQWLGLLKDGKPAPDYMTNSYYGGLPLAKFCKAGAAGSFDNVSKVFFKQCLTGQAVQPNTNTRVLSGQYLRVYNCYRISPSGGIRGDVLAAYGPAPTTRTVYRPWVRGESVHTFVWPFTPKPILGTLPNPDIVRGPPPPTKPRTGTPLAPRQPPGRGVKENKLKGSRLLVRLMGMLNNATEAVDLMDAFYDSLPDEYKAKFTKGMNKGQQEIAKAKALYRHWDKVDVDTAIFNALFSNLVEDRVYALLGLPTKPLGRAYGSNMGVNKLFSPLVSGAKPLLDGAKQSSSGALNNLGFTIK